MLACLLAPNAEWRHYAGDPGGSHDSELSQIDRANVPKLQVAWTYRTGALQPETDLNRKAAFECTPLMIGGTLYVVTPFNKVIALDAATGAEKWAFDSNIDRSRSYSEVTSRGLSAWRDHLFLGTIDGRLIVIDRRTGARLREIDLKRGVNDRGTGDYQVTSPPAIIDDLVIVGSSIGDNGSAVVERGVVRAFDAESGALRWSFDPLARFPRESGAANAWSVISVDPIRKLVFIPTSSPSPDYYGGFRPGDDRYANSVVALHAHTGKIAWHFQVVHHDLWDYDIASQPVLIKSGRVDAVAVTTKMGNLFILDRATGKPLLPVHEKSVPKSDVPGETASPTQPFTTALVPQGPVRSSDAWGVNEEDRDWCSKRIAELRSEGIFTPPSVRGTIVYPGNVGGVAWGGASYDRERRLLIVPLNRLPFMVRLIPRDDFVRQRQSGQDNRLRGEFAPQRGAPYGMYREPLMSSRGLPCIAPPWGTLAAIDVDSGRKKWEVPLGKREGAEGLPALGGALVTRGGLVFIAAAIGDDTLRAFDIETGRVVWESALPAGAQSTPMTYRINGTQYVVICAGGHGKAGTKQGDYVIAYTLR
ncbi:MAG TPA: pyrroloquinoline quinone-dependent dehydrogenase [Thermoanaerobaculia bacterium]|nr:pyrroloquinoline quinone-dependent dehydrogenase [Thermoanaerobaculia bacterium]